MEQKKTGLFGRLVEGLKKSRENFGANVDDIFELHPVVDEALFDEVEEGLIQADVGVEATLRIVEALRERAKADHISESVELIGTLKEELVKALAGSGPVMIPDKAVVLVVGVNGTGKTTTIAKLANLMKREGRKVLLGAADTFRAAAVEQLDIWAQRLSVEVVKHERGSDPAAVVFDAVKAAKAREADLLIVDTAGRLHTYVNLMEELKKIKRIAVRESDGMEIRTLLVIDATTGQNGIAQARLFNEALEVDGVILTKLDGTAKGGIAVAIEQELGIPIEYIGIGEKLDDLQPFDAEAFVEALVGR
ncbi:MAG: signal recognition particle-docking protein FtsY [Candidatus Aquicultorales bacterium]